MATNQSGYQLPNPQALDPYSIETALVNKLEPQYALGELNAYRADRGIAEQGYQRELDAQHEQARKQLEGTMANNAAERVIGAAAHPELLAAMRDMPQFSWMFGPGINGSGNVGQFFNQQTRLQNANIAEKGASATEKLAIAGLPTTTAGATGITGLPTYMDDSINVKAAAARAREPTIPAPVTLGAVNGSPYHMNIAIPESATPAEARDIYKKAIQRAYVLNNGIKFAPEIDPALVREALEELKTGQGTAPTAPAAPAPKGATPEGAGGTNMTAETNPLLGPLGPKAPAGITPLQPAPGGGAQAAPAPPNPTNLQPAPQQPTQSQPAPQKIEVDGPTTRGQIINEPRVQASVKAWFKTLPQQAKEDVLTKMGAENLGVVFPVFPRKGGGFVLMGQTGQYPVNIKMPSATP